MSIQENKEWMSSMFAMGSDLKLNILDLLAESDTSDPSTNSGLTGQRVV